VNTSLDTLLNYAPLSVTCVVLVVGLILALVRWPQHPGVSRTALLGCVVLLLNLVAGTALNYWLWRARAEHGWSIQQVSLYSSILGWFRVLVGALGYGLLFWAIFGWRNQGTYRPRLYDEPRPRPFGEDDHGRFDRGRPEDVRRPGY